MQASGCQSQLAFSKTQKVWTIMIRSRINEVQVCVTIKSSAEFMVLYHSTYHDKKTTVPGTHPLIRLPESFPLVLSYCTQAMLCSSFYLVL
jgi:hypothetical protein